MEREIKFRGLNNSGEFEYGHLVKYRGQLEGFVTAIQVLHDDGTVNYLIPVKPESVSQFIGEKDKNGIEVYFGDTVNVEPNTKTGRFEVVQYIMSGGFISIHPFQSDGYHWSALECEVVSETIKNP